MATMLPPSQATNSKPFHPFHDNEIKIVTQVRDGNNPQLPP
jgi:hypothetical protein